MGSSTTASVGPSVATTENSGVARNVAYSNFWTSVWSEQHSKDYFYNDETRQVAWELPAGAALDASRAPVAGQIHPPCQPDCLPSITLEDWERCYDPRNRREFFFNRITKVTCWEL